MSSTEPILLNEWAACPRLARHAALFAGDKWENQHMFGLIKRIKAARQADIRRRELMAEQDARIVKGFAELHTAVELVVQAESGRGPRGDVLRIGDGFYVERAEDGTERTVATLGGMS